MNQRIERLQSHLLDVASEWYAGDVTERDYFVFSACAIEYTLEMLCDDNAPQADLDYVGNMLAKLMVEYKH